MKKLLTITAVGALCSLPAMGAKQCVYLDTSDTVYEGAIDAPSYGTEWATNIQNQTIKGIGVCGYGTSANETTNSIPFNNVSQVDALRICYCRVLSPAISEWILYEMSDFDTCFKTCPYMCAGLLQRNAGFRRMLFNTIGNY